MDDRLFYPLIIVAALAMIALATAWPQGLGAPSPAPFGRPAPAGASAPAAAVRETPR